MAKRRMFSLDVVDTDSFLDLPASSQSLYFHLGMRADDDGFVSSPKRITAMVGAAGDDLKLLIAKGFVIPFESGVCVIRDWRVNNYIQRDRYTPSIYTEEKQRLSIAENGRYSHVDTQCIQDVSKSDTQVRIDKEREEIDNKAATPPRARFIPPTLEEVQAYCIERENSVDAAYFLDYYAANGWVQGSVKATAENNLPQFPSPGSTTRLRTHGGESVNSILNEYGVLGSLLIDPSLFPEAAELPDDMFSSVPLQEIFRAMRHQYEESGSFDALTVRVEAGRNCTDVTDKLIAGLMDTTPTTANLDVYLAAVKEAALARSLRKIGEELMTAEHDPTDALGRAQEALQRLAEENTRGDSQTLTAVLMQLGYRVSEQVGGRVPCVASGLLRFDKLLGGGFINGGLHVIGARPAVGKSALALQIALNAARNGVKVLYLSLEMSAEDCSARLVGNIGGLSSARLMFGGRLTDNEYTRFAEGTTALSALPLVFNKRTGMNVRQVEALAYREKPGLLILDHLGLLEPPEARLSLYEATTRNSRALKLLALRLNIPVLCLCQLNRAAASDRSGSFRATMANLRESGAIEQDADTVTLLHNPPCETGERMESPSLLELWLDKNRRGATGHVDATFYKVTGRVTA